MKSILYERTNMSLNPQVTPIYLGVVAFAGVALWIFRIRKLPLTNQVLALTTASVLLPPISHDYTLMHLYAPWAMLVFATLQGRRIPGLGIAFTCFALLFTPQSYLIYYSARFAGEFKSVVLVVLFLTSLRFAFADLDGAPHREASEA